MKEGRGSKILAMRAPKIVKQHTLNIPQDSKKITTNLFHSRVKSTPLDLTRVPRSYTIPHRKIMSTL